MKKSQSKSQQTMYPDKKRSFPNVEEGQQEQKETYGVLQHRISTDTFEEIMEKSFSDEKNIVEN